MYTEALTMLDDWEHPDGPGLANLRTAEAEPLDLPCTQGSEERGTTLLLAAFPWGITGAFLFKERPSQCRATLASKLMKRSGRSVSRAVESHLEEDGNRLCACAESAARASRVYAQNWHHVYAVVSLSGRRASRRGFANASRCCIYIAASLCLDLAVDIFCTVL